MSVVTKRQLNLLQVFMDSNRYLTGQKLSQLLNVSSKTIRNEIKISKRDIWDHLHVFKY